MRSVASLEAKQRLIDIVEGGEEQLIPDYPLTSDLRTAYSEDVKAMFKALGNGIVQEDEDMDIDSRKYFDGLKVVDTCLEGEAFQKGFKKMAHIMVHHVLVCDEADLEIFPNFVGKKNEARLTAALALLVSK